METKSLDKIKKEIIIDRWYSPREIANARWMIEYRGKDSYFYILKLIKGNRLKAKNFGLGKTNYWKVRGGDMIDYLEKITR